MTASPATPASWEWSPPREWPTAAQAIEELLADPAELIAATDSDLSTCRAEAEDLLGKAWDPAGATVPWESGEVVVWFVSGDAATLQSLAVFDPTGCVLLASRP